jgi:hypothetical protein
MTNAAADMINATNPLAKVPLVGSFYVTNNLEVVTPFNTIETSNFIVRIDNKAQSRSLLEG